MFNYKILNVSLIVLLVQIQLVPSFAADSWQSNGVTSKSWINIATSTNDNVAASTQHTDNQLPDKKSQDNKVKGQNVKDVIVGGENVVTVYTEVEQYLQDSESYGKSMRELRAIRTALDREYDSVSWRNKQQKLTERTDAFLQKFYSYDRELLRMLRIAYTEVLMYEPEKHISINDELRIERVLASRINLMNYRFIALWLVRRSKGGEFMPRDLVGFEQVCEQNIKCWNSFASTYKKKLTERTQAICKFLDDERGCDRYKALNEAWKRYISRLVGKNNKTSAAARAEAYALLLAYQELDELPLAFIYLDSKEIRNRYFGPDAFDIGL